MNNVEAASAEDSNETEAQAEVEQEPSKEPVSPDMKWYVVHTYSGFEMKVKQGLLDRCRTKGKSEFLGEVLIPSENVVEMVQGQKKTSTRKFFPGYILVQMIMSDEMWHFVKDTPKVTGFVGGGKKPTPVPEKEVSKLTKQITEGTLRPKMKLSFAKGDSVRVNEGPFQSFNGTVDEVKPDKGKLTVLVSIFGRLTPVELDYAQVEKN